MRFAGALLLCQLVGALGACVTIDREARLSYPPAPEDGQPAEPAPSVTTVEAPAVAVNVTDARPEPRTELGPLRNTFGMKMAAVKTHDNVPAWVAVAVGTELRRAGLRVTGLPDPKSTSETVLSVEIRTVRCDAYLTYGAEVTLASELLFPGRPTWHGTHTGQGGAGTNWTATEASFGLSLSRALHEAAHSLATEVRAQLAGQSPPSPPSPKPGS